MKKYCMHCMALLKENTDVCEQCQKSQSTQVAAHHLVPGTILNHKYYVGTSIGEGGFGIAFIGRDLTLDMKVAIKEYYPSGYVNRSHTVSNKVHVSISENKKDFFEKGCECFT